METFKEMAKSDEKGMIFTFVWALDLPSEFEYIDRTVDIFKAENAEIFYVELEASLATRLIRNKHTDRLLEKPSKRLTDTSQNILYHEEKYQLNTKAGEFDRPNHFKVNNENLEPDEVARMVCEHFGW